jgi:hypothetical protein
VMIGAQTPSVDVGAAVSGPVGPSTFNVQQLAVANLATANTLPVALMEQVFGSLEQSAVMQESALVQPGAILSSESGDQAPNGVRDLALLQTPAATVQADWLSDDYVAYLTQTSGRGLLASTATLPEGAAAGGEETDLEAGLEAYFAREASQTNQPRLR